MERGTSRDIRTGWTDSSLGFIDAPSWLRRGSPSGGVHAPRCVTQYDPTANSQPVPREVPGVGLERGAIWHAWRVGRTSLREVAGTGHHVLNRANDAQRIHEGNIEGDACAEHPESSRCRLLRWIYEEHAGGVGEMVPLHEPKTLLIRTLGQLCQQSHGIRACQPHPRG